MASFVLFSYCQTQTQATNYTENDHYISLEICKAWKAELRVCPKYDSGHPKKEKKKKEMMLLFSTKRQQSRILGHGMAWHILSSISRR